MIQYYFPHLAVSDILNACFEKRAHSKIVEFYKKLTGKEFIILTNSCRSALYLAYLAIDKKGEVITSPLTCRSAIDPIVQAGLIPIFIDIDSNNLTMNPSLIEGSINSSTIAIQAIHLGGVSCDTPRIKEISQKYNLLMIEDCAQGFGASFNGIKCGVLADISCFSMIKNAYGISGGIFATNDSDLYRRAGQIINNKKKSSFKFTCYRVFRNLLESHKNTRGARLTLNLIVSAKNRLKKESTRIPLRRQNAADIRINCVQLYKSNGLNDMRKALGTELISRLKDYGYMRCYNISYPECVYTKIYLYSEGMNISNTINALALKNIEAKHLEHSDPWRYQEKLSNDPSLINYQAIHDHLISIPIHERMEYADINTLIMGIQEVTSN